MFGWKTFTDNGKYWVSTSSLKDIGTAAGIENMLDYTYETMVFPVVGGQIVYDEKDCLRTNDEDAAYLNHLKMFEKYNNL